MGFHKRYIRKQYILSRMDILKSLFNADALIMDTWSGRFYDNLNPIEKDVRIFLNEKYAFDSGGKFIEDEEYKKLKSLSEALISLTLNPSWIDICFTIDRLKIDVDRETESGRFDILVEKCKKSIVDHYDR